MKEFTIATGWNIEETKKLKNGHNKYFLCAKTYRELRRQHDPSISKYRLQKDIHIMEQLFDLWRISCFNLYHACRIDLEEINIIMRDAQTINEIMDIVESKIKSCSNNDPNMHFEKLSDYKFEWIMKKSKQLSKIRKRQISKVDDLENSKSQEPVSKCPHNQPEPWIIDTKNGLPHSKRICLEENHPMRVFNNPFKHPTTNEEKNPLVTMEINPKSHPNSPILPPKKIPNNPLESFQNNIPGIQQMSHTKNPPNLPSKPLKKPTKNPRKKHPKDVRPIKQSKNPPKKLWKIFQQRQQTLHRITKRKIIHTKMSIIHPRKQQKSH